MHNTRPPCGCNSVKGLKTDTQKQSYPLDYTAILSSKSPTAPMLYIAAGSQVTECSSDPTATFAAEQQAGLTNGHRGPRQEVGRVADGPSG